MTNVLDEFWKKLYLEDYEDNCEIIIETDDLKTLKVEYDLLREHSVRWLHFVAVDYPDIKESLSPQKLMELKEKAGKWDTIKKFYDLERLKMMVEIMEDDRSCSETETKQ